MPLPSKLEQETDGGKKKIMVANMKNSDSNYALLNITKLLSPDLSTYRREELSRAVDTLERAGAIVWPKDNPCKQGEIVARLEN